MFLFCLCHYLKCKALKKVLYNSENLPLMGWQGEKNKSIRSTEANQKGNQQRLTGIFYFSQVLWMAHEHLQFPPAVTLGSWE